MNPVSLGKNHGLLATTHFFSRGKPCFLFAKPHSASSSIFCEKKWIGILERLGPTSHRAIFCKSLFYWIFGLLWLPLLNPKNPKNLETGKRCRGVSHILTRYRFIGLFGNTGLGQINRGDLFSFSNFFVFCIFAVSRLTSTNPKI